MESKKMPTKPPRELKAALRFLAVNQDAEALAEVESIAALPGHISKGKMPTRQVQIARLYKDAFSCRTCGKALVPVPIMRAASLFWPSLIPYHANWETRGGDSIYVQFAATFDVVALRATTQGAERFMTLCWPCKSKRGRFVAEESDVAAVDPLHTKWRGLVPQYLELEERIKAQSVDQWIKVHRLWMRDLGDAERELGGHWEE